MSRVATGAVLALIRAYQAGVSPGLGPRCRYEPSCSAYAYTAVRRFGALRGSWMAVRRLARCRPGSAGGFDPVPDVHVEGTRADADRAAPSVADTGAPHVA